MISKRRLSEINEKNKTDEKKSCNLLYAAWGFEKSQR